MYHKVFLGVKLKVLTQWVVRNVSADSVYILTYASADVTASNTTI